MVTTQLAQQVFGLWNSELQAHQEPLDVDRVRDCFISPETPSTGMVSAGVAYSLEDQIGRLTVATARYDSEKYLTDVKRIQMNVPAETILKGSLDDFVKQLPVNSAIDFLKLGLVVICKDQQGVERHIYLDKYNWSSIPIVVCDSQEDGSKRYIGSTRLIVKTDKVDLPTLSSDDIVISPDTSSGFSIEDLKSVSLEMSQLARLDNSANVHPGVHFAILRVAGLVSRAMNESRWLATTDNKVIKLLNGRLKFDIKPIGPTVYYLGSDTTPGLIDIDHSIASTRNAGNVELSKFLDGEQNVPGFEWYVGP